MHWHIFRFSQASEGGGEEGKEGQMEYQIEVDKQPAESNPLNLPRTYRDHTQPICLSAGTDCLLKLGEPTGANSRTNISIEQLWKEEVEKNFQKMPDEESLQTHSLKQMHKFAEEKVDKMRMQKD